MPLPLILAGAAVLAAGYGVKKGIDAHSDFGEAGDINKRAVARVDKAQESLSKSRHDAQEAISRLGGEKLDVYQNSIIPFVESFQKIKKIEAEGLKGIDSNLALPDASDAAKLAASASSMKDVVAGGLAALGTGGLAGLAAFGSVGLLGSASTGTAIASLSGVAATNATLAWLGGGSLAAGGFGAAGGVAVLGGIVAGPVLAIGGIVAASKAEAAKEDAYANRAHSQLVAEELGLAAELSEGIRVRVEEVYQVLSGLNKRFVPFLEGIQCLIEEEPVRQEKARKRKIRDLSENLVQLEGALGQYIDSKNGFWNRIRYFFMSNPYEHRFSAVCDSFYDDSVTVLAAESVFLKKMEGKITPASAKEYVDTLKVKLKNALEAVEVGEIRFDLMSEEDKKGVFFAFSIAKVMRDICEAPLITKEGVLTAESRQVVISGRKELDQISVEMKA